LPDHQALNMDHLPFIKLWVRGCSGSYGDATPRYRNDGVNVGRTF
jgi:hypothetical protein